MISKKAYTLIEILVVVSIIGILFTLGIAAYNNFNEQRKIRAAADELKTAIRLAASKAKNNEKDCKVCGGTDEICGNFDGDFPLDGWHLELDTGSVRIYGECVEEFGSQSIETFGVTITPSIADIMFYPPAYGGGTDLSSELTITLGGTETVIIDPSGNVY